MTQRGRRSASPAGEGVPWVLDVLNLFRLRGGASLSLPLVGLGHQHDDRLKGVIFEDLSGESHGDGVIETAESIPGPDSVPASRGCGLA